MLETPYGTMLPPDGEFDAIRRIQAETQAMIDRIRVVLAEQREMQYRTQPANVPPPTLPKPPQAIDVRPRFAETNRAP